MSYSLSEAATACGVHKSTILRSIRAGRLTGTKDALGQWRIEPAELHRVYTPAQRNGADSNGAHPGITAALVVAQDRAERLEERLAMLTLVSTICAFSATSGSNRPSGWRSPMRGRGSRGGAASLPSGSCRFPLPWSVDHSPNTRRVCSIRISSAMLDAKLHENDHLWSICLLLTSAGEIEITGFHAARPRSPIVSNRDDRARSF